MTLRLLAALALSALAAVAPAADPPAAHRHGRFEAAFTSSKDYSNALLDVRVTVAVTGPGGKTRSAEAFWDGERTWRARFSPEAAGDYQFATTCSDPANSGLHDRRGRFHCEEYRGDNPVYRHGPVRVAADGFHLEHADGTPFFWLSDTAWGGPMLSQAGDWAEYLTDRRAKRFTAVQFMGTQNVAAAGDAQGRQAFSGKDKAVIDPYFFRRLDARFDAVNDAGLVASPTFAWAAEWHPSAKLLDPGAWLPDDQLVAFGRYFVARYGAHQVVWMFAGDHDYRPPQQAERWRKLGRAIFGEAPARLVTVHPAPRMLLKKEFGEEPWVGFLGYQSSHTSGDDTVRWITRGEPAAEWNQGTPKPVINIEPIYEAIRNGATKKPATALDVRRACWWSVLASPPAGVSYGAHGVWSWEAQPAIPLNHVAFGIARPWHEAMHLPGATHMTHLRAALDRVPWTALRPDPALVAAQPGDANPQHHVGATKAADGKAAVLYFPAAVTAALDLSRLAGPVSGVWFDPTSGATTPGSPGGSGRVEFTAPGPNAAGDDDWVLVLTADPGK